MCTEFWLESLKGRDNLELLGVYKRTILSGSQVKKLGGNLWTGFIWLGVGTGDEFFQHGNERSAFI